ncbi:MAG: hypothetical protein ABW352_18470 [Polyangiales bacterium]
MRYPCLLLLASLSLACSDDDPDDPAQPDALDGGQDAGSDAATASIDARVALDARAANDATPGRQDAQVELPGCTVERTYVMQVSYGSSTSYEHTLRGSTLTLRGRSNGGAISECEHSLAPCGDPARIDAIDLKLALSADDVRDRFADDLLNASYGIGNYDIFGGLWVLTIMRDDGKLLQIGGWDCTPELASCRQVPPDMVVLRELVRAMIDERWVKFPSAPFSGRCSELQGS